MAENGKVIVTGCLGKRAELIREAHPGVLSISGPQDYGSVMDAVHAALPPKHDPFLDLVPDTGIKLTPKHYAYLKISEGCNHRCSFCIIPSMRGDLVSRPVDEVLREAEKLAMGGVKELLVISQDTSAYGVDVKYAAARMARQGLPDAHEGAVRRPGRARHVDAPALRLSVSARRRHHPADGRTATKLLPYLDIPFQHASPRVLKLMKRPGAVDKTLERIQRWREICPDITIRRTFIVGFPGETEAEFEELLDFLDEAQLDRVGAFAYSPVEGASGQCAARSGAGRGQAGAPGAASWSARPRSPRPSSKRKVGTMQRCLVDALDGELAIARSMADAPEIDGLVQIQNGFDGRPEAGRVRRCRDHGQRRARPVRRSGVRRLKPQSVCPSPVSASPASPARTRPPSRPGPRLRAARIAGCR